MIGAWLFLLHDPEGSDWRCLLHDPDGLQGRAGPPHDPQRVDASSHDSKFIYWDVLWTLQKGSHCLRFHRII